MVCNLFQAAEPIYHYQFYCVTLAYYLKHFQGTSWVFIGTQVEKPWSKAAHLCDKMVSYRSKVTLIKKNFTLNYTIFFNIFLVSLVPFDCLYYFRYFFCYQVDHLFHQVLGKAGIWTHIQGPWLDFSLRPYSHETFWRPILR